MCLIYSTPRAGQRANSLRNIIRVGAMWILGHLIPEGTYLLGIGQLSRTYLPMEQSIISKPKEWSVHVNEPVLTFSNIRSCHECPETKTRCNMQPLVYNGQWMTWDRPGLPWRPWPPKFLWIQYHQWQIEVYKHQNENSKCSQNSTSLHSIL